MAWGFLGFKRTRSKSLERAAEEVAIATAELGLEVAKMKLREIKRAQAEKQNGR